MKAFTYTCRIYRASVRPPRRFLSFTFHPHNALSNEPKPKLERPPPTHQSPFVDPNSVHQQIRDEERKIKYLSMCALTCMGLIYLLVSQYTDGKELKAEASSSSNSIFQKDPKTPIIIGETVTKQPPNTEVELIDSGTSSTPPLPKKLYIPLQSNSAKVEEYTLLGHGIRTVSFLKIQVYVVGFYVHSSDLPTLQQSLIRKINRIATTLTQPEQDQLSSLLYDPEKGPKLFEEIIFHNDERPIRSLFRIVPTRNTDWSHLRDGWVRGIQSRALPGLQQDLQPSQVSDLSHSIQAFKSLFQSGLPHHGKSVPKQKTILLLRSHNPDQPHGTLTILYDPSGRNDGNVGNNESEKEKLQILGQVRDERISRALWLCYLSGKQVASEEARRRVVEGLVGLVSRPIGTIGVETSII